MTTWNDVIIDVQTHLAGLEDAGCDYPFFRGHADSSWKLLCGLGRKRAEDFKKNDIESILYYDFQSLAGPLLKRPDASWEILFSMQHHGLPTRLLDWSSTFAVALYFALRPYLSVASAAPEAFEFLHYCPSVWVLDPFELNRSMRKGEVILNPEIHLEGSYQQIFIDESKNLGAKVVAVNPAQTGRRLAAQRGCFTLHRDLFSPLEAKDPRYLKQFLLPKEAIADGIRFLRLAGMNEYSLFPDLDGLARHLASLHV